MPRRQVCITTMISTASASGSQPPSTTLSRLAPKNTASTMKKGATRAATTNSGQRQRLRIKRKAMIVVVSMVPLMAMP